MGFVLILLMDLPEPVHGMANVNLAVKDYLEREKVDFKVLNTSPSYASRFFMKRPWILIKIIHSFFCVCRFLFVILTSRRKVLYRPINGGLGQIYDVMYFLVARFFFIKIYIHHHSFDYLNSPTLLFRIVSSLAGRGAVHVVLGDRMRRKLIEIYDVNPHCIRVLSNMAYFDGHKKEKIFFDDKFVIGHLANLCVDKGLLVFIDVCRDLKKKGIIFQAKLAGPFLDARARTMVEDALREFDNLEYMGPVYGDKKNQFYRDLDVFIFPSLYKNEAEPLVLYEAAENGAYVCGTRRGCMEDVIAKLGGDSFPDDLIVSRLSSAVVSFYANFDKRYNKNYYMSIFNCQHEKSVDSLRSFVAELVENELSET